MAYQGDDLHPQSESADSEDSIVRRVVTEFGANLVIARVHDGRIVRRWVGREVAAICGCSCEELETHLEIWYEVIHPADRDRVRECQDRMLSQRKPSTVEYRIVRLDGQTRWVRESCSVECDESGCVVRVIGCWMDVTAQRSTLENLLSLKQLLDETPCAVVITDAQSRVIYCNEAASRLCGYGSTQEMLGSAWRDALPEASGKEFEEKLWPRLWEGPWSGDVTLTRRDGTTVDAHASTNVLRESDGTPYALYSILTEARERQGPERELREWAEHYRAVVENVDGVIFRVDPQFRPIVLAGRPEQISGYTITEFLQTPELWAGALHPDDWEAVQRKVGELAVAHEPTYVEHRIVAKDGSTRWLRTQLTPRFDEQGNLIYLDGVGFDITRQVEAHEREARYASRMAALAEISQIFTSSLEFEQISRAATEVVSRVLDCTCAVVMVDRSTGRLSSPAAHDRDPGKIAALDAAAEKVRLNFGATIGGIDLSKAAVTPDLRLASPELAMLADLADLGPGMIAPVYAADDTVCFVACARQRGAPPFEEEDVWFLSEVASHASAALTTANLHRRQLRIAETLQRSLIPESPKLECVDIATCYRPAVGEAEVGGDFFDVIHMEPHVVGIVVGDVSGKGIQAAVHTAETKYMLRGFAHENPDPEYVVRALNEALCAYISEFNYVTLVYVVIDVGRRELTCVNAGHEPPVVVCRDGTVTELMPSGPVLGVIRGIDYRASSVALSADELLLCYTDGVTDVPANSDRFGRDRLIQVAVKGPNGRSQDLLDHIIDAVREFGKGKQPDDQAIVVARLVG